MSQVDLGAVTRTHIVYCVIAMSNKELARKTEVERAIDHRITQTAAACKLGISERQFRRIVQRYRQEGDKGLVSRKRGKTSNGKRILRYGIR